MDNISPKPLIWVGSSRRDLRGFPDEVQDAIGYALYLVQIGQTPLAAKPLHGFGGASVLEIVEDFDRDTYRAVYTVRFAGVVYVLHVFQKKSKRGRATCRQMWNSSSSVYWWQRHTIRTGCKTGERSRNYDARPAIWC